MKKELQKRILSSIILIPLSFFFITKGSIFFNFFAIVILLITLYEWHFLSLKKAYYLPGFIFIILSFYTFFFLRHDGDYRIFLLIILTCIATDVGGYVFGKIFKGPKLTKISPKKTYSGAVGSIIFSLIFGHAYLYFLNPTLIDHMSIILFILLISITSQVGDLIISFLKRKANTKDAGYILPGHGGILDRIDGMLLALPLGIIFLST